MASLMMNVTLELTNREAVEAITRITEIALDIKEDMPWREDADELLAACERLIENVAMRVES